MSASYHVDLQNTGLYVTSLVTAAPTGSGAPVVGQWVDLNNAGTFTNIFVATGGTSGPLQIAVQTADSISGNIFSGAGPVSGNFTDPTSGLAQLPTSLLSGGILLLNSGLYTIPGGQGASGQLVNGYPIGTLPFGVNPIMNGMGGQASLLSGSYPELCSGGISFAGFQRPGRYARLMLLSGSTLPPSIIAGFFGQMDTTGSGGGFTYSPQSGTGVNV